MTTTAARAAFRCWTNTARSESEPPAIACRSQLPTHLEANWRDCGGESRSQHNDFSKQHLGTFQNPDPVTCKVLHSRAALPSSVPPVSYHHPPVRERLAFLRIISLMRAPPPFSSPSSGLTIFPDKRIERAVELSVVCETAKIDFEVHGHDMRFSCHGARVKHDLETVSTLANVTVYE